MGIASGAADKTEPLIGSSRTKQADFKQESFGCCYAFKRFFNMTISKEKRKLGVDGRTVPSHFMTNRMNN